MFVLKAGQILNRIDSIKTLVEEIHNKTLNNNITPFINKYRSFVGSDVVVFDTNHHPTMEQTVGQLISIGTTCDFVNGILEENNHLLILSTNETTKVIKFGPGVSIYRLKE